MASIPSEIKPEASVDEASVKYRATILFFYFFFFARLFLPPEKKIFVGIFGGCNFNRNKRLPISVVFFLFFFFTFILFSRCFSLFLPVSFSTRHAPRAQKYRGGNIWMFDYDRLRSRTNRSRGHRSLFSPSARQLLPTTIFE